MLRSHGWLSPEHVAVRFGPRRTMIPVSGDPLSVVKTGQLIGYVLLDFLPSSFRQHRETQNGGRKNVFLRSIRSSYEGSSNLSEKAHTARNFRGSSSEERWSFLTTERHFVS